MVNASRERGSGGGKAKGADLVEGLDVLDVQLAQERVWYVYHRSWAVPVAWRACGGESTRSLRRDSKRSRLRSSSPRRLRFLPVSAAMDAVKDLADNSKTFVNDGQAVRSPALYRRASGDVSEHSNTHPHLNTAPYAVYLAVYKARQEG